MGSITDGGAVSGAGLLGARAGALFGAGLGLAAAGLGWAWFEAGWVRLEELEVPLDGLAPELAGLRIAHLSDFHLGVPSRGRVATERAVDWVAERKPDLVCITGDLLARAGGEPLLRRLAARLPQPAFAILGNHDFAISRDPFSDRTAIRDLGPVRLLSDEGATIELRGRRVYVAGADPRSRWANKRTQPAELAVSRDDADLRILLAHYPGLVDDLPPNAFDLVLAGHMHGGQINLPYPGGKLHLAHLGARFTRGLYRVPAGTMHVSAGLGTTFVPFRFAARPEATELVLQPG
jgi:predicted MPP superfamily phosphohydrolase